LAIFAGIFILQPQSLNDPLQKRFEEVKGRIIKNPTDPELRLDLAQIYKEANDLRKAKEEILVALQYSPDSPVLKKNLEEIKKLEEKPQKIKVEIKKWEGVVSLYPDYRDAWFRLSVLYWQIFDEEKAKFALAKTLELDPNFQPAYNFKNLLK
jgi:tetratricopeptide (TPR) repeat protein